MSLFINEGRRNRDLLVVGFKNYMYICNQCQSTLKL
jgi:hypothetical protein